MLLPFKNSLMNILTRFIELTKTELINILIGYFNKFVCRDKPFYVGIQAASRKSAPMMKHYLNKSHLLRRCNLNVFHRNPYCFYSGFFIDLRRVAKANLSLATVMFSAQVLTTT